MNVEKVNVIQCSVFAWNVTEDETSQEDHDRNSHALKHLPLKQTEVSYKKAISHCKSNTMSYD